MNKNECARSAARRNAKPPGNLDDLLPTAGSWFDDPNDCMGLDDRETVGGFSIYPAFGLVEHRPGIDG